MVSLEDEMREIRREKKELLMAGLYIQRSDRALASLKRDVRILNSYLAVKQHGQKDVSSLKKQLEELKYEKSLLCEQEMTSLSTELEEFKQENQSLLRENWDIQNQVVSLESKLSGVKQATDSLLTRNQDRKQEKDLLKKEIQDLKSELAVLSTHRQLGQQKESSIQKIIIAKGRSIRSLNADNVMLRHLLLQEFQKNVDLGISVAHLKGHIATLDNVFYLEKQSDLESCRQTVQAEFNGKLHKLKQQLTSKNAKLDYMTFLHAKACDERTARESELTKRHIAQLKKILQECQEVKRETECLRRSRKEKQEEYEKSLRQASEPDLKDTHTTQEMMVSPGRLDCLEGRLTRLIQMEADLIDATVCLRIACEGDIQELVTGRNMCPF